MHTPRLLQLMYAVAEAQRHDDHTRALRLVLSNFPHLSDPAPLRERVAMTLAALGRTQEAVDIYKLVGHHYANIGQGTRALAVAKQLSALAFEREADALFDYVASLYNIRSPRLSDAPRETIAEPVEIDLTGKDPQLSGTELEDLAVARALDQKGIVATAQSVPAIPLLSLLPEDAFKVVVKEIEFSVYDEATIIARAEQLQRTLVWSVTDDLTFESGSQRWGIPSGALIGVNNFGTSGRGPECDVSAQPGSETLQLTASSIAFLQSRIPDFENRLATLRRHAMTERLIRRHPMFSGLNDQSRVGVIASFLGMRVSGGEQIIAQGAPSPGLFIVLDGEVDVVQQDGDWEITIATLAAGDVFGEIGLIANRPATAGCTMTKAGHLLHLSRAEFSALVARYPSIAEYTANLAEDRMNEATLSGSDVAELD